MGYQLLFWGFLFFFDIEINGVDLLPDIIGHVLIFLGLHKMSGQNSYYAKGKNIGAALIVVTVISWLLAWFGVILAGAMLIAIGTAILQLYLTYLICHGIKVEAVLFEMREIAIRINKAWRIYLYATIGSIVLIGAVLGFPIPFAIILIIVDGLAILIAIVMMMRVCQQMGRIHLAGGFNEQIEKSAE